MVLLDRVIFCPEVPLDERKRCVPSPSIALVARRQEPGQEHQDSFSEMLQNLSEYGCGDPGHVYTYDSS